MARPKEFDARESLSRALQVFWHKGYANTSMQDLTEAMGIGRQSLYDTFGDKHELFLASLRHYISVEGIHWVHPLINPGSGREAIHLAFENIVEEAVSDPHRNGCLAVNAAVESAAKDADVRECVLKATVATEAYFLTAIMAAQASGEIAPERDAKMLASYLMNAVRGLRVLARIDPDRTTMDGIVRLTLMVMD